MNEDYVYKDFDDWLSVFQSAHGEVEGKTISDNLRVWIISFANVAFDSARMIKDKDLTVTDIPKSFVQETLDL